MPIAWGVLCVDCLRVAAIAAVGAFAAGFGTAVAVKVFEGTGQ